MGSVLGMKDGNRLSLISLVEAWGCGMCIASKQELVESRNWVPSYPAFRESLTAKSSTPATERKKGSEGSNCCALKDISFI